MRYIALIAIQLLLYSKASSQPYLFNWLCASNSKGPLNDEGRSVIEYLNNSYVIGSFKSNTIALGAITLTNTSSGTSDIFVAKYTNCGVVVWAKNFGTVNDDQGITITQNSGNLYFSGSFNSNFIAVGNFTLNNNGGDDFFVAKMDVNGNIIWANAWGGTGDEVPKCIKAQSLNSSIDLVGEYTSNFVIGTNSLTNSGNEDFFYMQITSTGSIVVAKGYGSAGSDKVNCVQDQLMCGFFNSASLTIGTNTLVNSNSGTYDSFVINLDAGFNEVWVTGFGNIGDDVLTSLFKSQSTVDFVGYFNSPSLTIGNTTLTNANTGTKDAILIGAVIGGTLNKARSFGNIGNEEARSILPGPMGVNVISGIFDSATFTLSNMFGPITVTNSTPGTFDIFTCNVWDYTLVIDPRTIGGPGDDIIFNSSVSTTNFDVYQLVGSFNGATCSFSTITTLTNSGASDYFISRFRPFISVGMNETKIGQKIKFYPNPLNDKLVIQTEVEVKIKIIDILGKIIYEDKVSGLKEVDFSSQTKGLYLMNISSDKETATLKLIKE